MTLTSSVVEATAGEVTAHAESLSAQRAPTDLKVFNDINYPVTNSEGKDILEKKNLLKPVVIIHRFVFLFISHCVNNTLYTTA